MHSSTPRILIVDDEPENLRALERTLRNKFEVVACSTPVEVLEKLGNDGEEFAVLIADQRMPGMLGTELLQRVARMKPLITRVILTAFTDTKEMLDAINRAEIYRYATKPWDNDELQVTVQQAYEFHRLRRENQELIQTLEERNRILSEKELALKKLNIELESLVEQRTQELRLANEKLSELAMTDPLTKVLNRRGFFIKFNDEIERSSRYKHTISVAMIDVDHFKSFNDMEGHVFGDEALKKLAHILISKLRKTDILARYGGEEFVLMMPETGIQSALEICERLRAAIEATTFQGQNGSAYLTISIGIADYPSQGETTQELIKSADQALYQAKEFGRNRVSR
jgi:diguanylate cyclase (GGDEF)-like protein